MRPLALALALSALCASAQDRKAPASGKTPFGSSYYLLDLPTDYSPARRHGLIVMLHGSGGRPEMYRQSFKAALAKGYLVCLPASIDPNGYDDRDEKQVVAMVEDVIAKHPVDRDRLLVTGHSAGGAISFFFVANRPDLFTACAPGAAGLRFPAERLKQAAHVPFYIVTGKKDPNFAECERSVEPLRRLGIDVKFEGPEEWGHQLHPDAWAHILAWFEGLASPETVALLQGARVHLDRKAWGKADAAAKKIEGLKSATSYAKARAARVRAEVEGAAAKLLDEAKAADEAGDTKKAVSILGKAKSSFDGSAAAKLIDEALKSYKAKLEPAK